MSATTAVSKTKEEVADQEEALLLKKKKKDEKKEKKEKKAKKTKKEGDADSAVRKTTKTKKKTKEGSGEAAADGATTGELKKKKKKKKPTAKGEDQSEVKKDKKKKKKKKPEGAPSTGTDVEPRSVQQLVKDVQDAPTTPPAPKAAGAATAAPAADDSDDDDEEAAAYPTETSQEKALRIIKETKDSCRYAIALTSLQLKDDQFPEEFSDLEDIATSVDLSFNLLADIPLPLLLLSNLQRLKMQSNVLEKFSLLRGAFASLQELDLSGNNLTSLPIEIGYLANLRVFDASNNRLEALPAEIGALTKLEEFRLSGNLLCELPKTIGNCSRLEILDLVGCKLKQLPDQITYLSKLVELDVSANLLESLPAAIGLLPRLNELKATNNSLTDLPSPSPAFHTSSSNALLSFLKERLTTTIGDPKQVREYMKGLGEQREPLVQVTAPQDGKGGFVIQEKLSHEKEVQRKAETEKKDVELRDKILHLKKLSVDQYSRVNEWVYEMKNRNWAQNDPQASIHLATYVGQLKGQMDVMKERIAPYVMENYKTVQAQAMMMNEKRAQEGEDKMILLKKSVDVSLDNVSVVVRALMKGIREDPDMGKVVLFAKDLVTFYNHFGKFFGEGAAPEAEPAQPQQ
ncbi:leucine rich repeat domain containing protein [Acanthamoeba castellanii str. Neff]|uniref:Leucine rich repeat domain containing protein n=1 Tax=Acanthamoeba castellanii (strain ATCC 30010 / Neff) TaxID=1257118 RepID=L8GU14_ACACF|nr:leucine rich repeat domain containing protein [Acanthamoeba castellanii str. Neff]ELR15581.1 leucine rich repeat domain containing protein [Acanthamoeba castellanii str. Neff]